MKKWMWMPLACILAYGAAQAETTAVAAPANSAPDRSAVEAALTACSSSATKDANGYVDQAAMENCMTQKGYSRPTGLPPGGQGNHPPARPK